MWKLQICKENDDDVYYNYIEDVPTKIFDKNNNVIGHSLRGNYMGSSTRISEVGTIYYDVTKNTHKIKIRLLDENNKILFDKQLSDIDIANLTQLDLKYSFDNVELFVRDLHRWENYPYEISGIAIYK